MAITKITGLTAQRMIEIEQNSVVSGTVEGDQLILTTKGGKPITAGNVRGPQGVPGPPGGPVDATATVTGGLRLTGNLKGTATNPQVTGALDNTVNLSNAQATGSYGGTSTTWNAATIVAKIQELFGTYLKKSGSATTIWDGTEAEYSNLPAATKNAAGFIAVVRP